MGDGEQVSDQAIGQRVAACLVVVALVVAALAGCAQAPPVPHELLSAAESAVARARTAAAGGDEPLALMRAEAKLQAAHAAARAQAHARARALAEQALVDAELAEVQAQAAQAEQTARRLRERVEQHRRVASGGNGA